MSLFMVLLLSDLIFRQRRVQSGLGSVWLIEFARDVELRKAYLRG
jgi:hypothetical protein